MFFKDCTVLFTNEKFEFDAFGADFYDRSTRTTVGTMLWTEYWPVIKIGPKGTLGSHEIRPIHSAISLGQSINKNNVGTYVHVRMG